MSDCYAIACTKCRLSLWIGQWGGTADFYVYTTENETKALSRFLIEHRGEDHPLIFDNSQEFIYGYREIDAKTLSVVDDDFFDEPTGAIDADLPGLPTPVNITIPHDLIRMAREYPALDWNEVMRHSVKWEDQRERATCLTEASRSGGWE